MFFFIFRLVLRPVFLWGLYVLWLLLWGIFMSLSLMSPIRATDSPDDSQPHIGSFLIGA